MFSIFIYPETHFRVTSLSERRRQLTPTAWSKNSEMIRRGSSIRSTERWTLSTPIRWSASRSDWWSTSGSSSESFLPQSSIRCTQRLKEKELFSTENQWRCKMFTQVSLEEEGQIKQQKNVVVAVFEVKFSELSLTNRSHFRSVTVKTSRMLSSWWKFMLGMDKNPKKFSSKTSKRQFPKYMPSGPSVRKLLN